MNDMKVALQNEPQPTKIKINYKKYGRKWKLVKIYIFCNTNCDLISGILIQLAAATAANGTSRPTIGGAF